ncbi:MAG: 16S rRNA (uracil(1498)-N(3))-methyltransferase [Candidatus Dadabacteria bacterium]|nr:16S rRNA (uracil(1498)-N(3))-methyltransferase [Candidatus Dadabacteria bacterium]
MPRLPIRQNQIKNSKAIVSGQDYRHIVKVLRLKPGNEITLFDERGIEHVGKILELGSKEIKIAIAESKMVSKESLLNITLLQGMPKGDKMDYIIEKATELGVKKIVPVVTERSQIRDTKRIDRWRRIALESSKQSGRTLAPLIFDATSFQNAIDSNDPYNLQIVFYEKSSDQIRDVIDMANKHFSNVRLFVGPEGGFTEREISTAKEKGFIPVGLGPRILRTDTAGIVAIAVIQFLYGDI